MRAAQSAILSLLISLSAPPTAQDIQLPPDVAAHIANLAAPEYQTRENATNALLDRGPDLIPTLRDAQRTATDPEVLHRLEYILANIEPPRRAALILNATPDANLQPGDVVTHANGVPVYAQHELRQQLVASAGGALLQVRNRGRVREVGPVRIQQIQRISDFVAPRGPIIAAAVREYAAGFAEQAYQRLKNLGPDVPTRELPAALRARIAYTAGDGTLALALLARAEDLLSIRGGPTWNAPTPLDTIGPGRAPFFLEWQLITDRGPASLHVRSDPDVRIQRILVPAHRYPDAFLASVRFWHNDYRDRLGQNSDADGTAGNQLAVAAWMLHDLNLRSEALRLIAPRSAILRNTIRNFNQWVRVDTRAWLDFFAGNEPAAVASFFEDAIRILQRPLAPTDAGYVVQRPEIAARIAFFIYHSLEEERAAEVLSYVCVPDHPVLNHYVDWMLYALRPENVDLIQRDLQICLPLITTDALLPFGRAALLLEAQRPRPDHEALHAARQTIFDAPPSAERDTWLAISDAFIALARNDQPAAAAALASVPDAHATNTLRHTLTYLRDVAVHLPPGASAANPVVAVPAGNGDQAWFILTRDRRILRVNTTDGRASAITLPTKSWFPIPRNWPWLSRASTSGRTWIYDRRRIAEIRPDGTLGVQLNTPRNLTQTFERLAAQHFAIIADSAKPPPATRENGEFLRSELHANLGFTTNPNLPELSNLAPLDPDARFVQVTFRGGPDLLLDRSARRYWSSADIAAAFEDLTTARFQAVAPPGPKPELILLLSEHGLLQLEPATDTITRRPLPAENPFPPLIPENLPYQRRDPNFVYFATLPAAGGEVFRWVRNTATVEAVDMTNIALPSAYYARYTRADLRDQLTNMLQAEQLLGLQEFIQDAQARVAAWAEKQDGE